MRQSVNFRLSLMMFLQYAERGFWLPVLSRYLQADPSVGGLGFTPGQVGWILSMAGSVGAITAPFVAGQIADRHFPTERFLAVILFLSAILQWIMSYQTTFMAWLVLAVIFSVIYVPTMSLTNSLAFAHLDDPARQFPRVRVWGTIGFITAGWLFPAVWLLTDLRFQWLPPFYAGTDVPGVTGLLVDGLRFSAVLGVFYAGFCLLLPHTPPKREGVEPLAVAKAFRLFRKRSFAILVAACLPISIVHQIYFMQTAPYLAKAMGLRDSLLLPVMTIGQFAELVVMAFLSLMLKRLGFRLVIVLGALAYALRFAIFGTVELPQELIIASIALHGFCYACFFAAGFIYVDRICTADIRNSAQTVFAIIILGVGPVLAAPFLDVLARLFTTGGSLDYSLLWYTLAGVSLVTAAFFGVMFRDESAAPVGELPRTKRS